MKRNKAFVLLIVSLLALSLMMTGCANKGGQSNLNVVRLSEVTHSVFYAPQYVALAQGFFREQGIEIELFNGAGADKVMTAVLTGQADIGLAGPEASVYVYNEGKDDNALIFAQLTNRDGTFLMGRPPDPNFQWSDVKGKTIIGGRKGGMPELVLQYVLRRNGVTPGTDVNIDTTMQFAAMTGAFLAGQGDYVIVFEPTASEMVKAGKAHVLASLGQSSGDIAYTAYFAKKSYVLGNQQLIQGFTNAIFKGQQWVKAHSPEEIAAVIKPYFPDADDQILTSAVKRYKDQDTWKTDPILLEKDLDTLQKVLREAGELKKNAPYNRIVTPIFGEGAFESMPKIDPVIW